MVTVVSCCSLVGISIMPLISGRFYKSSITLFTGLAVGSLLGSAIFSLIPQAFNLHTQPDKAYLWKSLIIFLGIYMFYCSERMMRIYFDRKTRHQKHRATAAEQLNLKDHSDRSGVDQQHASKQHKQNGKKTTEDVPSSLSTNHETDRHDVDLRKETSGGSGGDEELPLDVPNHSVQHHHHHHHHHHDSLKPHEIITKALMGGETTNQQTATSRSSSGISGGLPEINVPRKATEIAPVAWMIIIGDGLHNFIDGLSIGAAFTESIYQGMVICVAVIFEELPHELGDFAVLISSGMTVRQALGFNFLSACTCYIGMVCGIILGDTTQSASFIFALAAGMFFYISLVDMMGELSATLEDCKHSTRESAHLLLMQNIGILSGISIIFSLSLFGPGG